MEYEPSSAAAPTITSDAILSGDDIHTNSSRHAQLRFGALALIVALPSFVSAKPDSTNTGPTTPVAQLRVLSSLDITQDGQVVEGVYVKGPVKIQANNVTLRNFKVETSELYGVRMTYNNTGIVLEDGEISGMNSAAILGSGFTARRLHIHNSASDGIKPYSDAIIEDSWIHSLGFNESSHADGVQMVRGGNVIIRRNNFDMPHDEPGYKNSQVMIIKTDDAVIDNVTIEDNWINGGGYSIQVRQTSSFGAPTRVVIRNNKFGTDYQFGPWIVDGSNTMCNNVWEISGSLLTGQTSGCGPVAAKPGAPVLTSVQ
jgi:hypothetical protein